MQKGKMLFILLFVIVIIFISFVNLKNTTKNTQEIQYLQECLDERICIKKNGHWLVGNNIKELENGYYDFIICNTEKGIKININKLWFKSFNEKLYEEEYVDMLCSYISKIVFNSANISLDKNDLEKLKVNILMGYAKAKDNIEYKESVAKENVKFIFYGENCELILNMEVL